MLYETLLLGEMLGGATTYRLDRWCVDLEIDDAQQTKLTTRAPFIMVNNQPGLGGKYMPAPLTSNTDGVFNVLLVEAESIASQARVLLQMRAGRMPDSAAVRSFETKRAIFRAAPQARDLLFFGDGEILIRDAREIEVVCLPHALSVYVEREYGR
jgi:diacylglycerol kinase family enzyme